jgi:hypothetical protein
MTIAELGSLGELIASLGVLVTLIYLAIQMRQNTKAVRLNTAHAITEEFQEIFSLLASNRGLSEVFVEAAQNEELSGVSRVRYNTYMGSTLRAYENAYLQNREQAINLDHWAGLTRMMIDITALPAFPIFWADRKHWFSDGFQVHMDTNIVPTPAKAGVNIPGNYSK